MYIRRPPRKSVIHKYPFVINELQGSAGLMGNTSRGGVIAQYTNRGYVHNPDQSGVDIRVSACISSVDYPPRQLREIIQHYMIIGFQHVYLAVPLPSYTQLYNDMLNSLRDYISEGSVSVIESYYAHKTASQPYNWQYFGHRSAFNHACMYSARFHNDDFVYIGDIDELPIPLVPREFRNVPANRTTYNIENLADEDNGDSVDSIVDDMGDNADEDADKSVDTRDEYFKNPIGVAIQRSLNARGYTLGESCIINLGSCMAIRGPHGIDGAVLLGDRFPTQTCLIPGISASTYGKSFHYVKTSMRVGQHTGCLCEGQVQRFDIECVKARATAMEAPNWSDGLIDKSWRDIPCQQVRIIRQHFGSIFEYLNFFA